MFDLGPHASFIIAAYGITFIAVGALTVATFEGDRKQRRMIAELERKGIRRRSAAKPNVPPAKTAPKKRALAKRKPAKSRTRKSSA